MGCCFNVNIPFCLMKYYFFEVFFSNKIVTLIIKSLPIYFFSLPHLYKVQKQYADISLFSTSINELGARLTLSFFLPTYVISVVIFEILMERHSRYPNNSRTLLINVIMLRGKIGPKMDI